MFPRPDWLFDRTREWGLLSDFLKGPAGTRLAVVYGRRRQGKTALTRAWAEAAGGFHWEATEVEASQNLASLSDAWSDWSGAQGIVRFATWNDAVTQLCSAGHSAGHDQPVPVVLDEINRVIERVPELPSLFQRALGPGGHAHRAGRTRLVLCGSAFGAMRRLLDGPAALRGRASIDLVIEPFDYRTAAEFWGLTDRPHMAFELHSLVGGTPAYLELASEDRPQGTRLDDWVVRRLLEPASALYREGRVVITEDSALTDRQLYWALLAAIADGNRRWTDIERELGGSRGSLKHAMDIVIEAGWVTKRPDPLRAQRSVYELSEPIVRFQRLVVDPNGSRIAARRRPELVWNDVRPIVAARITGPHLETIAAEWIQRFANASTVGGVSDLVGPSELPNQQLDLVVTERTGRGNDVVIAVCEVKATSERVGLTQLNRLDEGVAVVEQRYPKKVAPKRTIRRLLVSKNGFTTDLVRTVARRDDVELIDLDRLYHGE